MTVNADIRSVMTSSPTGSDRWRLPGGVVLILVHDGTGRLIDLDGSISALTESGATMLELALREGFEPACHRLAFRYGVDAECLRADMQVFFRELVAQKSLIPPGMTLRRRPLRRFLSWTAYPIVFLMARQPTRWMPTKAWLLLTLIFFATRLFGWTNAIRVWDLAGSTLMAKRAVADPDIVTAIDSVVTRTMARHLLPVSCKERALCCWVLARAGGVPARVQLGIDLFPFGLHCWCEHESKIIADRYEGRCDRYTPLRVYG